MLVWFCRWVLIRQTRRMLNPRGPKTERGSAAGPENGIANPRQLANVTALVIGIALNLLKGNVRLCVFFFFVWLHFVPSRLFVFGGAGTFRDRRMKEREKERDRDRGRKDRDGHRRDKDRGKRSRFVWPVFACHPNTLNASSCYNMGLKPIMSSYLTEAPHLGLGIQKSRGRRILKQKRRKIQRKKKK